jgi:hypothetical protein
MAVSFVFLSGGLVLDPYEAVLGTVFKPFFVLKIDPHSSNTSETPVIVP